jgi:glycosyltransferase involved in cell wall biosynthesis
VAGVTIAVATFGADHWRQVAEQHALPSAYATGAPVVYAHGASIHGARNACLDQVKTEHVIYLDADDELESGYLDAMATVDADIRVPVVRYVTNPNRLPAPSMPKVVGHHHSCSAECLPCGNWIVIGAMARTKLLRDVGGWRDFGWEDWDLWLRCHLAGATIKPASGAVYRANVHPNSRGRYTAEESRRHHLAVAEANGFNIDGIPLAAGRKIRV